MSSIVHNEILLFDSDFQKLDDFKGINYKIEENHKYYDCGAHFSFKEICKILENVVMSLPADRRGVSMYEDDEVNLNTDSKKKLRVNYEQVCRFVEHYDSNPDLHLVGNTNNISSCILTQVQTEINQTNLFIKNKDQENQPKNQIKVHTVNSENPPNDLFYRKINPSKNIKNGLISNKNVNKIYLSKMINEKREKTTLFSGNVSDPKKSNKINLSKPLIKNMEKRKVNNEYTSPISNNVSIPDKYKNPVTSFELANKSLEKNFIKLNFSKQKVLKDKKPLSNNRKIITSLIENTINNTVYCKAKSRNIEKIFTVKTNENSKNNENKTFLTNNNTKDTFPSSNKLLSSNITLPFDKKPSNEHKKIQFDKSKDDGKNQSKFFNLTYEKTSEKVNKKNINDTDNLKNKNKKLPTTSLNNYLKNIFRPKKSVKNKIV